jgi:fumarate hydratase class I
MVDPPSLDAWPKLEYDVHTARRVNLDTVTHEDVKTWKPGEVILLSRQTADWPRRCA